MERRRFLRAAGVGAAATISPGFIGPVSGAARRLYEKRNLSGMVGGDADVMMVKPGSANDLYDEVSARLRA